eukprot:PhM_4_TR17216/c0_g1_i1/m.49009
MMEKRCIALWICVFMWVLYSQLYRVPPSIATPRASELKAAVVITATPTTAASKHNKRKEGSIKFTGTSDDLFDLYATELSSCVQDARRRGQPVRYHHANLLVPFVRNRNITKMGDLEDLWRLGVDRRRQLRWKGQDYVRDVLREARD